MKFKTFVFGFATVALAVASAASETYNVKIYTASKIGQTDLKAGDYKVQVEGDKAIFKSGKNVVEVPATTQDNDKKFESTTMESANGQINAINIGGTKTKLVFKATGSAASGGR